MQEVIFLPGSFQIYDWESWFFFKRLIRFLGAESVQKKFESVDRELQIEKGVYRDNWVLPHRSWWVGLSEAIAVRQRGQSFAGQLGPRMKLPLETAVKLTHLLGDMPKEKCFEYRQRILGAYNLKTVLIEIDIASHYLQKGCSIEWLSQSKYDRMPEFKIKRGHIEFEIECKTKGTDAGRRVTRPAFFRLVDTLAPLILGFRLQGECRVLVHDQMPTNFKWRKAIASCVNTALRTGETAIDLGPDGTITLNLRAQDGTKLTREAITQIELADTDYSHNMFYGLSRGNALINPIQFVVESRKPDQYLQNILNDLRDATRQFTGKRPAIIVCFIPEIESFSGLERTSAIKNMTQYFFQKHAPSFVHSVAYASDGRIESIGAGAERSYMPALSFKNPRSDANFPDDILENTK